MKHLIIIMMLLASTIIINAKNDYRNPISTTEIGKIEIQITQLHDPIERSVYLAIDKYQNHYLAVGVNYFINKGKDALNVTFNNGQTIRIPLAVSYKKAFKNGLQRYVPSMWIGRTFIGGHYVSDYGANFYCAYPLTEEQYEWLINEGIQSISVDEIYQITYKSLERDH